MLKHGQTGTKNLNRAIDETLGIATIDDARDAALAAIETARPLPTYTVDTVPDATDAANLRRLIHVSDGAAGFPCLAFCNGTNWLQVALGSAIVAE